MRTLRLAVLLLRIIPLWPDNPAQPDLDALAEQCNAAGGYWNYYENAAHDAGWWECDDSDSGEEPDSSTMEND